VLILLVVTKKSARELVTAGFGGVAATLVDIVFLVFLVEVITLSIPIAAFLASGAGAAMNFVLNKYLAFRDRSPITLRQVASFAAVAVATALLMALAMKLVAVELGVPYVVAKLLCAITIFMVWTYPAQRKLVFARVRGDADPASSLA
jgi:putative flippase GtrA